MRSPQDELADLRPFEPAGGKLERRQAAHLLRRTGFLASAAEVGRACDEGLERAVARLVEQEDPGPGVRELDAVRAVVLELEDLESLQAWWLQRMIASECPLREKLALFWHGHFATSHVKVNSVAAMAAQLALFHERPFGPLPALTLAISRDVAMLRWLDSRTNHKRHPNENYARELMELFTLGIGNYGERDVQEAARAFTGWSERDGRFVFDTAAHDDGEKTVFGETGAWDGDDVVALCFAQPAAARFVAGKLLRFFLHPEPPPDAIDAFAALLAQARFDLHAPLAALFRSRAFYSAPAYRALVKSPVELLVGTLRALGRPLAGKSAAGALARMGQNLFLPPTVKGWNGQLDWISTGSMIARCRALAESVSSGPPIGEAIDLLLDGELEPAVRAPLERFARERAGDARGVLLALLVLPEYQVG